MTNESHRMIESRRALINGIDARIIELLQAREKVSHEIMRERLHNGGRRTDLTREMVVLRRYQDAFPAHGTAVGTKILELCRNRDPHPALVSLVARTPDPRGPAGPDVSAPSATVQDAAPAPAGTAGGLLR